MPAIFYIVHIVPIIVDIDFSGVLDGSNGIWNWVKWSSGISLGANDDYVLGRLTENEKYAVFCISTM